MKISQYREIIDKYNNCSRRNCIEELMKAFPDVSEDTMYCIIFQEYQRKMQRTKKQHVEQMAKYFTKYCIVSVRSTEPGFLIKLADEVDLSPALMARLILEERYKARCPEKKPNILREMVEKHIRDPSLIKDGQLALEVTLCHRDDQFYGPVADAIRSSLGTDYELNLRRKLTNLGVSYLDEESLRSKGFDKTPDIRLEVPIAIGGRVINWIESKASFGDIERHKKYLNEQYSKYKHRFGPGMVIYWFGFIDELSAYRRKKLIISDHMPEDITILKVLPQEEEGDMQKTTDACGSNITTAHSSGEESS